MARIALPLARTALLLALPLGACARQAAPSVAAVPEPASAAAAPSISDAAFLDQAARSALAIVEEGEMAEQRASSEALRRFAAEQVTGHARDSGALAALAEQAQVALPSAPSDRQQEMIGELEGLNGAAFDRAYLGQQVALHQAALALYEAEARQGRNDAIREFAAGAVPALQRDLSKATALAAAAGS